jgi:hypothetical protein
VVVVLGVLRVLLLVVIVVAVVVVAVVVVVVVVLLVLAAVVLLLLLLLLLAKARTVRLVQSLRAQGALDRRGDALGSPGLRVLLVVHATAAAASAGAHVCRACFRVRSHFSERPPRACFWRLWEEVLMRVTSVTAVCQIGAHQSAAAPHTAHWHGQGNQGSRTCLKAPVQSTAPEESLFCRQN